MALRNGLRALGVLVLLLALSLLLFIAQPKPLVKVQADEPTKEAMEKPTRLTADVPLELRWKIDPRVLKAFDAGMESPDVLDLGGPQVRYLVHLRPKADLPTLASVADAKQRRAAVVDALRQTAEESQAVLLSDLEARKASGAVSALRSYWIFNGLAVTSNLETMLAVAARPEVEMIKADQVHHLPPVTKVEVSASAAPVEWNIAKIGADQAWTAFGLRGEGVVVATLDSGVDWTHPALQPKYRGYDPTNPSQSQHDYNWFDATETYPAAPDDGDGHGTHTMGTIVGSLPSGENQVGVAPDAQWMAAKVFDDNGDAYDSWIHEGFQWILAPTDRNGQNPNPSLAPDICSNSWGDSDGSDTTFWDDVTALRAAGIFAPFAIGNKYQGSLAPHSPGSFPQSFAVGATDRNDVVTSWSCRGPSPWNEIKPEVTAPGANIRSTLPDGRYGLLDGTSMATPHVAGLAALLYQAQRQYAPLSALERSGISITATEQIITRTAHPLPDAASVPNNDYGWGRIDAYQAVGSVAQGGSFRGRVTDAASGDGISGALITMVNQQFGGASQAWTDPLGYYTFSVAAGIYDVTATHFYYAPQSVTAVQIMAQATTQLDFRLTALPAGRAVGRVVEAATEQPIQATVRTIERSAQVSTDAQGYYTLTLPLGRHALEAVPATAGHKIGQGEVTVESQGQVVQQDFYLEAIPKILLVDADAWVTTGTLDHYARSLEALRYSYDTWLVNSRSSSGVGNFPPATTLQEYDVVVWAQALSSPGYIGAWPALAAYLDAGNALLLSGQDVGYWDVEREFGIVNDRNYYEEYLHADYMRDNSEIQDIFGLDTTLAEGITLTLNTEDSAGNQVDPSEIGALDATAAPIFAYAGDGHAGLTIDECQGYRAVYLAFGLEGAGPQAARTEALQRMMDWLVKPRPDHALNLALPTQQATGAPGGELSLDLSIVNAGLQEDSYIISLEGNRWPALVWDPAAMRAVSTTPTISPCFSAGLVLRVAIPEEAVTGQTDAMTLTVRSQAAPEVGQTRLVQATASMPWTPLTPLPTPRYRLAAAADAAACRFFVIGGWGPYDEALRSNEMYDLRTQTWQAMAPKTTATANTAAAVIDGRIYIPGGMRGEDRLFVLEIYDPDTDTWTRGADMPQAVTGMAVAAAGGKLYVFGGNADGGAILDETRQYDPDTQLWSTRAAMPAGPRTYAAATELEGKIYVAGGWPSLKTFERYDPATDSWTSLAPLPSGRHSLGLVAADGYIYAVGGADSWTGLNAVERYNPRANSWMPMSSMASPLRGGTAVVSLAGRIFALGGATEGGGTGDAHEALTVGSSLGDSSLAVDREIVGAGGELAYTITLRNPGRQAIPGAAFHDTLPSHTTYVPGSLSGGAAYNATAKRIEWQGSVPAGSSKVFGFRVALAADLSRGTIITNTAWVDDGLCGEQSMSAATTIEAADLTHSLKEVDKQVAWGGDELSYRIELSNIGAFTATDVHLVDPLPAYLTYVPGSVAGATLNQALGQIEWSGSLPPGAEGPYRWADSDSGGVAYEWVDAAADGTAVPGGGDDRSLGPFNIGFPFTFYDTQYTQFYLNTNGQVLFGSGSSTYANAGIPNPSVPNNFVAPFWDDLISEQGTMHYRLLGSAPNRRLAIEWTGVRHYMGSGSLTFEVILFEGSDQIVLQYHTLSGASANGDDATVGIENADGSDGIQYQHNGLGPGYPLHEGLAVLFAPVAKHPITFRARLAPNVPLNTLVTNEAQLHLNGQPSLVMTATTRIGLVELPHAKMVDKPLAVGGEDLSYLIELSNAGAVTDTHVALVDPLPEYLTYVPDSVTGAAYNEGLNQIEWSGNLPPAAEGDYRWTDSNTGDATYAWVDATQDGISVPGGGDDRSLGPFNIGFPFTFYGTEYSQFYINTNGQVLFGAGSSALSNVGIPNVGTPNNFVALFWDDLVSDPGTMYYKLLGDAPSRRLVIEWAAVQRYGSSGSLTFEVILHETSNRIVVQYHTLSGGYADGESATVGIENAPGAEGIQYQYNGVGPGYPLHDGLAVVFEPAAQGHQIAFRARVAPSVPLNTLITNEAQLVVNGQPAAPLTATTWVNRVDFSNSSLDVRPSEAPAGERLTYTIQVRNSGNVTATYASMYNPMPLGVAYVEDSVTGGAAYNADEERIEWRGTVAPRGTVPISFQVDTPSDAPHRTPITNTATFDDGLGNVFTKTVVTVLQSYDLTASEKLMPAYARPGETVTCTVQLRNTGAVSTSASLTDAMPAGMTLVPGSLWWSSGEGSEDIGTVTWHGALIARGLAIVRFRVQMDPELELGYSVVNVAEIEDSFGNIYERSASSTIYSGAYPGMIYLPVVLKAAARPGSD
jgi:uncharacterized repeat protein (TIGR01451 family)